MKTALKISVVALATLSLAACGGTSKKSSKRRTRTATSSAIATKGFEHYQKGMYIRPENNTDYYQSMTTKSTNHGMTATFTTMDKMDKDTYGKYIDCVMRKLDGNTNFTVLTQRQQTALNGRLVHCCSAYTTTHYSHTQSNYTGEPGSRAYADSNVATAGLSVSDAVINMVNRELLTGYCEKNTTT